MTEDSSKAIEGIGAKYTSVWVGTPVHFWTVSSPVRSWLQLHKAQLVDEEGKLKINLGLFASMNGKGDIETFQEIHNVLNVTATAKIQTLTVLNRDLQDFDGSKAPKLEL